MLKRVRGGFTVHLNGKAHSEGEVIDLTEQEIEMVAHQIEDVEPEHHPAPTAKKGRASASS